MSSNQEQAEGHRALLEIESRFNAKSRGAVLGLQGSQIYALTMFGQIFEQFPYPVVINAAILKLADWFRMSNNVVKFYVYKVFRQASDQHLTKVINVEETVRRILPVLSSNDPIGRSLTLRILGCMAMIIAEKTEVHHAIIHRLELASDRIEMEAAIWAADCICARSARFPSAVFPRIAAKLSDKDTLINMKLRLVRVFRHMYKDITMARHAKAVCVTMLQDPSLDERLVIVTLHTLTSLFNEALIDRRDQIDRLLYYAEHDKRESVRSGALYDLALLGRKDITFGKQDIIRLLSVVSTMQDNPQLQQKGFTCAYTLVRSHGQLVAQSIMSAQHSANQREMMTAITLCEDTLKHAIRDLNSSLIVSCCRLLTAIVQVTLERPQSSNAMDVDDDADSVAGKAEIKAMGVRVASLIDKTVLDGIVTTGNMDAKKTRQIQELLKRKAKLYVLLDDLNWETSFRQGFESMLASSNEVGSFLLSYLSTIAYKCPQLSGWFPQAALHVMNENIANPPLIIKIVKLLFRTTPCGQADLVDTVMSFLRRFGDWDEQKETFSSNTWSLYLIAKEAGACGWFQVMYFLLRDLRKAVESEACNYWMCALSKIGLAEWTLTKHAQATEGTETMNNALSEATQHYLDVMTQMQAFQSLYETRTLQTWFVQLRTEMITSIQQTLNALSLVNDGTTGKHSPRLSKFMRRCAVRFRKLAFRYDFVAQSFCGIDGQTLGVLEVYKICALACEHAARTLISSSESFFCIDPSLIPLLNGIDKKETNAPEVTLKRSCVEFIRSVTEWEELEQDPQERLMRCANDIQEFIKTIIYQPLILPRYIFAGQKTVTVQLTVDPMLSDQRPVTLKMDQDLVVKFEGLLQVPPGIKLESGFQKASIVCFLTRRDISHIDDQLGMGLVFSDPVQALSEEVYKATLLQPPTVYSANIVNSYFSCTGLLRAPTPPNGPVFAEGATTGQTAWVNIFVRLIDEESKIWAVGPHKYGQVAW